MRRTVQEADLAMSVLRGMRLAVTRFTIVPELAGEFRGAAEEGVAQDVYKISELLSVIRPTGKQRTPRLQGTVTNRTVNLSAWHDQGFVNQDGLAGLLGFIFIEPMGEDDEVEMATLLLSSALFPKFKAALKKARQQI